MHVLSTAEMPYHSHSISQTPHAHGISDPGHSHVIINSVGQGLNIPAGPGQSIYNPLGATNTSPANTGITGTQGANANISVVQTLIGITVAGAYSSVHIDPAGGNAAHNNMPPFVAINYFIKT